MPPTLATNIDSPPKPRIYKWCSWNGYSWKHHWRLGDAKNRVGISSYSRPAINSRRILELDNFNRWHILYNIPRGTAINPWDDLLQPPTQPIQSWNSIQLPSHVWIDVPGIGEVYQATGQTVQLSIR